MRSKLIKVMVVLSVLLLPILIFMLFNMSLLMSSPVFSILVVAGIVFEIVTCVLFIITKKRNNKEAKSKIYGTEYTAEVTRITSTGSKNPNPMHRFHIEYKWTDRSGVEKNDASEYSYTYVEALALEKEKHIKIIADDKRSMIITKPNPNMLTALQTQYKDVYECKYCGTVFEKEENKCPFCGASKIKKK